MFAVSGAEQIDTRSIVLINALVKQKSVCTCHEKALQEMIPGLYVIYGCEASDTRSALSDTCPWSVSS